MEKVFMIGRLILGAIFLTFGLNGFLNFYPLPETTPQAQSFQQALWDSNYLMYLVKSIEVSAGILLLINRMVPVVLLLLVPITVNIVLVDTLLQPQHWFIGCLVFSLNIMLIINKKKHYKIEL